MEKRSSRKRSRKASEREEASEEPPAPLAKSRRRSSGGKSGEAEEKTRKGNARSKRKGLRVSFDILENRLSVGEGETAGSSEAGCTLTLASSSGDGPPSVTPEPAPQTGTAGTKDAGSRKPQTVEIKFKRPDFTFSFLSGKKRSWRSYKQVLAAERCLQWRPTDPTFCSLDAPPPLKPAKKYSDLSGLAGKYRDPLSGLQFHSSEEFRTIRSLPPDIVTGYLALRGKLPIM